MKQTAVVAWLLSWSALAGQPALAEASPESVSLAECRSIEDSTSRIECYDKIPLPTDSSGADQSRQPSDSDDGSADKLAESIDRHLANSLRDPSSATQYSLGRAAASCEQFGLPYKDSSCACYMVNAKNAHGGMVGRKLGMAVVRDIGSTFLTIAVPNQLVQVQTMKKCMDIGMEARDASMIHAHVK
jgi:hypothetical protein